MEQTGNVEGPPSNVIKLDFKEGIIVIRVSEEIKRKYETDPAFAANVQQQAYAKLLQQKEKEREVVQTEIVACTSEAQVCEKQGNNTSEKQGNNTSEKQANNTSDKQASRGTSCVVVDGGNIRVVRGKALIKNSNNKGKSLSISKPKAAQKRGHSSLTECEGTEAEVVEEIEQQMGDPVTSDDHEDDVTDEEESDGNVGSKKNWSVKQTRTFLAVYGTFKPKFDEPYSKKYKLWKKVAEAMGEKNVNVNAEQCAIKLKNLRRTYKNTKKPGAQQKSWLFYEKMDELFSRDPVIELNNVAEVNDKGCPRKKQKVNVTENNKTSNTKLDWKATITEIEKERVEVLRVIANSQAEKNTMLSRLTAAIEKIADK